jgi:hypothetical protein
MFIRGEILPYLGKTNSHKSFEVEAALYRMFPELSISSPHIGLGVDPRKSLNQRLTGERIGPCRAFKVAGL